MKVADLLLESERRTAIARIRETITKGKVVKIRFRAQRKDKGTKGKFKAYDLKRRKAARKAVMSAPTVVGLVVGTSASAVNSSGEGVGHTILHFPPPKPKKCKRVGTAFASSDSD